MKSQNKLEAPRTSFSARLLTEQKHKQPTLRSIPSHHRSKFTSHQYPSIMDKFKGIAKGGWHPAGDPKITRDNWRSDIKGMTVNRNKDPYEAQRSHQSAPLTSLKDPDSFGPPPKHNGWYGANGTPTSPAGSAASGGGWGSVVGTPVRRETQEQQQQQQQQIEEPPKPSGPYRTDTTGLSTNNLPKPPLRRGEGASPAPPPRSGVASPPVPARQAQPAPARQPQAPPARQAQPAAAAQRAPAPPPALPPRMNEHPDEFTPPPPPTYQEAAAQPAYQAQQQQQQQFPQQSQQQAQNPATINGVAVGRLAQAGVNVPGFGIGGNNGNASQEQSPQAAQGHPSQLGELQQRFSRMSTGGSGQASPPPAGSSAASAAAQKKAPPPPPPKKAGLGGNGSGNAEGAGSNAPAPPPLPLGSKPRPS